MRRQDSRKPCGELRGLHCWDPASDEERSPASLHDDPCKPERRLLPTLTARLQNAPVIGTGGGEDEQDRDQGRTQTCHSCRRPFRCAADRARLSRHRADRQRSARTECACRSGLERRAGMIGLGDDVHRRACAGAGRGSCAVAEMAAMRIERSASTGVQASRHPIDATQRRRARSGQSSSAYRYRPHRADPGKHAAGPHPVMRGER